MLDSIVRTRLEEIGATLSPTGSRYICNPPPDNTDEDWLVQLHGDRELSRAVTYLSEAGFEWEGSEHYQDMNSNQFMSWRRDAVNLILTKDSEFADKHREATELCKIRNLLAKSERIAVFQEILYGVPAKLHEVWDDEPF